eukprot:TRINITY_DN113152_c0_g1_i1.p1 TRINITY_DN113152_c0_g1~~TRINITY_DN113152_c0_g1_i1.p1  ORF type:complete len:276 (+),score=59.00 TRINITY_DN113152_c0_g1_i1:124-951(+)
MGDRKRARTSTSTAVSSGGDSLGGLYDFLPPPDPTKDQAAKEAAEKSEFKRPKLPPADPTRVIFLDIDGVLLPVGSLETIVIDGVPVPTRDTVRENDFSISSLGNLRHIVHQTGATIVLSSEWRRQEKLKSSVNAVLKSQDMPTLRDSTEIFSPKPELYKQSPLLAWCERRAREIGKWLKDHPDVTAWVALDDLDFAMADAVRVAGTPWIKYRSVHTHDKICITEEDAAQAIQILKNPPPEPRVLRRPSRDVEASPTSELFVTTEDSGPDRGRLG